MTRDDGGSFEHDGMLMPVGERERADLEIRKVTGIEARVTDDLEE